MIDPNDLPPCPFCGSHALEGLDAAAAGDDPVHCIDCGARGPCRLAALALKMKGVEYGIADGIEAWGIRAAIVALVALLSGCGGQVASSREDPVERFVAAVCACGDGFAGCPANARSEATGANPECLTMMAEAYERTCSPNPFPACEW
jgi:hypothetical protein